MANQYDNYVGFDYIPVPFEQYVKAGDMQQGKYDQSQNQLQDLQDKLAALPSRQIDVMGKNKIIDDYNQKALSILENNKTYNPNLQQQIRNLARETARDKRIQGITYAYGREKELKDLEKQMIARGESPYKYHEDWSKKAYVDPTGNEVWDNMYDTDFGIETKYDQYKAQSQYTKDIAPKLKSLGMTITDQGVVYTDKKTGQQTKLDMSFLKTGSAKTLNPKEQWVKDEVTKVLQPYLNSKEGKQFAHMQGSRYSNNDNSIQERYVGFKKQGLSDEEIKDIFIKDSATEGLLSTIKPVYEEQVKYDDITAALNSATGRGAGSGGSNDPFVIDELAKVAAGIPASAGTGQTDEFTVVNPEMKPELFKDDWLPKDRIEAARKRAGDRFKQTAEFEKNRTEFNKSRPSSYEGVISRNYQTQEDLDRYVAEEIKAEKQSFIKDAYKDSKNKYRSSVVPIPVEAIPTLKQTFYQFKPSDITITGGVSPDKRGTTLDMIVGEDYNNEVGLPSLIEDFTPTDQVNLKVPGKKATVPMVQGYVKITPDMFDKLSESDKAMVFKDSKGDAKNLTIKVSVPADRFYSSANALSVNQQYKVFDKDLDYQSIYENNTNVISQLPDQVEADFETFAQNQNKIDLPGGESIQFEPETEMVYRVNAKGQPVQKISLREYSLRNLQSKGQQIIQ